MIFPVWLLVVLVCGMMLSIQLRKLTASGALCGGALALAVYWGGGGTGLAMMVSFFLLGVAATAWQKEKKETIGATTKEEERRTAGQVAANAGVAALCGLLVPVFPHQAGLLHLMMAASFAAATADTLSSELGTVYGSRFYNILSFQKDQRGLDGVVSVEGTVLGIFGSAVIAGVYAAGFGWNSFFLLIILCGTIGNLADSVLGAALERRRFLGNNAVNFLNTLAAALSALLLHAVFL